MKKIQNQPLYIRKLIFWSILVILAIGLGFLWYKLAQKRLSEFRGEELKESFQMPKIELPNLELPAIEIEDIVKEGLQNNGENSATTTE